MDVERIETVGLENSIKTLEEDLEDLMERKVFHVELTRNQLRELKKFLEAYHGAENLSDIGTIKEVFFLAGSYPDGPDLDLRFKVKVKEIYMTDI